MDEQIKKEDLLELIKDIPEDTLKDTETIDIPSGEKIENFATRQEYHQNVIQEQDVAMRNKILTAIHNEIHSKIKVRKRIGWIVSIYISIVTIFCCVLICIPKIIDPKVKTVLSTVILGNTIGIITYFCKYAFSDSESLINLFHKINNNSSEDN